MALDDPLLDRLIERGLQNSPAVQAAQARLRAARGAVSLGQADLLPSISANGLTTKAKIDTGALFGGNAPRSTNLQFTSATFDASWEIDPFGGPSRQIEKAKADAEAQDAALQDSRVQLAAEIARAYVNLRAAQERAILARQTDVSRGQMLDLVRLRRAGGSATDGDVDRVVTDRAQSLAQLATVEGDRDSFLDQLAVLTGAEPGMLDADLAAAAPIPMPPAVVAVGDPTAMLRRRPDIRRAERQLASDNAAIGVEVANLFPKIRLLGALGFNAGSASDLLRSGSFGYLGMPSLSWDILDFGRTQANIRSAEATRDAGLADYRAAVLSALQDAEASLARYGHQREAVARLDEAQASATRSAERTRLRFEGGTTTLLDALDAERVRNQSQADFIVAQADLANDFVALQKALGLGWQ
jgi:NodT family efflux transporter outer membrane factor (OMF) lipoprotein